MYFIKNRVPLSELKQGTPIEVEPMKDDLNLNTVDEAHSLDKRKITVRKFFDED